MKLYCFYFLDVSIDDILKMSINELYNSCLFITEMPVYITDDISITDGCYKFTDSYTVLCRYVDFSNLIILRS